jgi:hypothetical protein
MVSDPNFFEKGLMIGRWDDAAHWPSVKTYPHHFHDGSSGHVQDSGVRTLDDLMKQVVLLLTKEKEK